MGEPGRPATDASDAPAACVACAAGLVGDYCHACGEARPRGRLRLGAVLRDAASAVLSLESGFAKTLVGLLRAPGRTIEEYVRGIRRTHCSPVRFFLWMLVVVVAGNALLDWLLPMDFTDPGMGLYPDWWMELGKGTPGWEKLSDPHRLERSYADMQRLMKVNAALQPLAFSATAWLVFLDKRRTYAEHLCFSLYAYGVTIVLTLLQASCIRFGPWWDFWLTAPLPYLYLSWAAAQFHGTGFWMGLLRTFAAGVLTMCLVTPVYLGLALWSISRGSR